MSIPRLTELLGNRARLHTIAITIADAAAVQTDTITIDGVACAFTSDATPTKQEVSNGLVAAIAAASAAGMFEVSQGAAPGYDITLRPVGPFLRPAVSVSANLTDTQSWGLSKLEKDLEDIKADVETLASTGVPVTALPGTSEADLAGIKAAVEGATPAGEAHIGEVGGSTLPVVVTPVIGAAAFTAGDFVGGKLTLANAGRVAAGTGIIQNLSIVDAAKQAAALRIYLFKADLAGTYADNAVESFTAADMLKLIDVIDVLAGDWETLTNASVTKAETLRGLGIPYKITSGTSLFAIIRTLGTPTYTANCLQLTFGLLRD